jgi:copper chaperone CopZ
MKHIFYVEMSCDGCKNAILKILNKLNDINNIEFDMINKYVIINGEIKLDPLMEALHKWGFASQKEVCYINTE